MATFFNASEILQFAVKIEKNGEALYRCIARNMEQKEVKDIFNYLADEDAKHFKIFGDMVSKIEEYEPPESYPHEYLAYLNAYANENIFSKEKRMELIANNIKTPKEALEFGMRIETDSILYYLEVKNIVPENQRGIIDKIVEEERSHYMRFLELKKKF